MMKSKKRNNKKGVSQKHSKFFKEKENQKKSVENLVKRGVTGKPVRFFLKLFSKK